MKEIKEEEKAREAAAQIISATSGDEPNDERKAESQHVAGDDTVDEHKPAKRQAVRLSGLTDDDAQTDLPFDPDNEEDESCAA